MATIVVTGAGSGIGAALTRLLVANGTTVLGLDRTAEAVPTGARAIACDLTEPDRIRAAADAVAAACRDGASPLSGIAAVAGVPGTASPRTVFAVNVLGLRRLVETVAPTMADGGSIVLVSSLAGHRGVASEEQIANLLAASDGELLDQVDRAGWDGPTAYRISKQLVHRYTVELAARLHPRRIRCTSVSPGPVQTPILDDFRATMPSLDEATRLVGRAARAEEIAAVLAFLLSPAASWVNGIDIQVDGGLSALRAVSHGS